MSSTWPCWSESKSREGLARKRRASILMGSTATGLMQSHSQALVAWEQASICLGWFLSATRLKFEQLRYVTVYGYNKSFSCISMYMYVCVHTHSHTHTHTHTHTTGVW